MAESALTCPAQHPRYENGVLVVDWCGKPATRYTRGDQHIDHFCEEDAQEAIAAGAQDLGLVSEGYPPFRRAAQTLASDTVAEVDRKAGSVQAPAPQADPT